MYRPRKGIIQKSIEEFLNSHLNSSYNLRRNGVLVVYKSNELPINIDIITKSQFYKIESSVYIPVIYKEYKVKLVHE